MQFSSGRVDVGSIEQTFVSQNILPQKKPRVNAVFIEFLRIYGIFLEKPLNL